MIQILVCDKIYVTPEMRRKKIIYKIYFILSILVVISLFTYYIYAEYDRNKSEQVSQEILNNIDVAVEVDQYDEPEKEGVQSSRVMLDDDSIVVVLNDTSEEEINIDDLVATAKQQMQQSEGGNPAAIPKLYKASDGTEYYTIAVITIPKIGIQYPVLSTWSDALLENAPCKFSGPDPNQIGNFVIVAHNYRNEKANKFFTNIHNLNVLDKIQITDMSNKTVEYAVYKKEVIESDDFSGIGQETSGRREITLITCYNQGKQRTMIKAIAIGDE